MLNRTGFPLLSAFSDFISLLRLEVNIYHNAKVCGDWVINEHTLGATCFHLVTQGRCQLEVPGHLSTQMNIGDLVIFPRELAHSMHQIDDFSGPQQHLSYDNARQGTGMLCGEVQVMHLYQSQLLNALPAVLFIANNDQVPWLNNMLALLVNQSQQQEQGDPVILNRLCELLFVYALRHYQQNQPSQSGILALYSDNRLANAIKAFHQAPGLKWDLVNLAKQAGMSRTVFSASFKRLSGWTVNQYTTWWRMQIAWEQLRRGDKVIDVALQIGYQSEAAFSRAFQKQFGLSAGQVRRQ